MKFEIWRYGHCGVAETDDELLATVEADSEGKAFNEYAKQNSDARFDKYWQKWVLGKSVILHAKEVKT